MRLFFVVLALGLVYWLAQGLGSLLVPLGASLLFAYLLDPFIRWLEERGIDRQWAILLSLSAGFVLLAVVLLFMVPPLVDQIVTIIEDIPTAIEKIRGEWIPWFEAQFGAAVPASVRESLEGTSDRLAEDLPELARRAGTWTLGAASRTSQVLLGVFSFLLVPLFTYYFLTKMRSVRAGLVSMLPIRRREYTLELLGRMHRAVGDWFRGQVQVAALLGLLYSIGLSVVFALTVIDFQLGIAIGIVAGVLNIVPYLGALVATVLTALVVLLDWPGWPGVLGVVIVFVVNNLLESYVLTPRIVGKSVGLNPIAVIILALIGGELAGVAGILLIIPIAGALLVIWPDLMA
ncbi:MAG: AI-2E family transporter, partial [Bradymonadaceae bacterium]